MKNNKDVVVIANWKMNLRKDEALELLRAYSAIVCEKAELVIAPSFPYLDIVSSAGFITGAQDCSIIDQDFGAFTGEVSAKILSSIGVKYVILGHSERRKFFGEDNVTIGRKAINVVRSGMVPIICVGEGYEVRTKGLASKYVADQVRECISAFGDIDNKKFIIAYEPLWAIGTGNIPSFSDIEEMHSCIKITLKNISLMFEKNVRVVYGGSVKASNAREIISLAEVDGLLVGGASMIASEFSSIVRACDGKL